jgi:hypothetical protein
MIEMLRPSVESFSEAHYYPKPREVVSSGGFDVEYSRSVDQQSLYNDVIAYLGEYRFGLGRYDYPLQFVQDSLGARIIDPVSGESMRAKTKRAIWDKRINKHSSVREEADDEGMGSLVDSMVTAKEGDSIWWGSLPGRVEDNFGTYAFIHVGQVIRTIQTREGVRKDMAMSSIRVENPSLEAFSEDYDKLTGQNLNAATPEDLLRSPVVISGTTRDLLEKEIRNKFIVNGGEDEKEWFDSAIADLQPAIEDFMYLAKHGTREEKLDAFHTLEKHAAQLQRLRKEGGVSNIGFRLRLDELQMVYKDVELENAGGSCPIINTSGNIFGSTYDALNKALFGESWNGEYNEDGPCVTCGADVPCGPCKVCKACTEADNAKRRWAAA